MIDESDETNNNAVFKGAYLSSGSLYIHGDDADNTIDITDDGTNYNVAIDQVMALSVNKSAVGQYNYVNVSPALAA